MGYVYKPGITSSASKSKKTKRTTSSSTDQQYIKTIIKYNVISLGIVIITFFAFILVFSNINNLWGMFRPDEKYVEENKNKPAKPFLKSEKEATNEDKVSLDGVAGSGQKVTLFKDNNKAGEAIADSDSKFTFSDIDINTTQDSTTEFYVVSKNDKGEESEQSNLVKIKFDKKKPDLTISSPNNDDRIKSFSRSLQVTGKTESDAKVTVNERVASVNQNGEYSATIALVDEVNTIKVESTDKAGNKNIQQIGVYFEKID